MWALERFGQHPVNQLRREMDDLFSSTFTSWPLSGPAAMLQPRGYPALNVWEEGEAFFVEAEVPGLKQNELEIFVTGNELTLKGNLVSSAREGEAIHREERPKGAFSRVIHLPVELNAAKVEASLKNGILVMKLPKSEAAKPKKIEINTVN